MDPKKIYIIKEWLILKNISEVLFYLGFTNFYHRFIKNYLKLVLSLTNLTKKDINWVWNNNTKRAFQGLKKRFSKK